jgi:protein-S-isoprenylcysteine O-methyltransferase Ste14
MHASDLSADVRRQAAPEGPSKLRLGRLVGLSLASCGIAVQGILLARALSAVEGDSVMPGGAHVLAAALSLLVYVLMVGAYLIRRERAASDSSWLARCVAVCVTFLPFVMPLWPGRQLPMATDMLASVVLVAGLAGCVWSLRHLWTSFSVIPQARTLVSSGPYRWVRHPLYTTEIIVNLGLAIHYGRPYHWAVFLLIIAGQTYRARREERLLCAHLDGYAEYRTRTAALIPGFR